MPEIEWPVSDEAVRDAWTGRDLGRIAAALEVIATLLYRRRVLDIRPGDVIPADATFDAVAEELREDLRFLRDLDYLNEPADA